MTVEEILSKLKSGANDSVRKHNIKYGANENQFGTKLGDIRALAKTIKPDNQLAKQLWETGNAEAQLLSTLIVQPKKLSADEIDKMVESINFSQVADWLSAYVIKEHPEKETLRKKWMTAKDTWRARAGWSLTSGRVARDPEGIDIEALLKRIEKEMPTAVHDVQWTMNTTLAQIGIHFPEFREQAIGLGERLGVFRDYPVSKGCTSPFAPIWINEMVRRQQ